MISILSPEVLIDVSAIVSSTTYRFRTGVSGIETCECKWETVGRTLWHQREKDSDNLPTGLRNEVISIKIGINREMRYTLLLNTCRSAPAPGQRLCAAQAKRNRY